MVSRVERGERLLSRGELDAWLTASRVVAEMRDRVETLAEAAHGETRSWSDMLGAGEHLQAVAAERDDAARRIDVVTTNLIPGLLQTADYARRVIAETDMTGRMDYTAAVAARIERQQILYDAKREFRFLIEQAALEWSPGPNVMPEQLDRLLSLATLPNVTLGVLPTRRTGFLSWHSFTYRQPVDDTPPYVTTELLHGGQVISGPDAVELYAAFFARLWSAAKTGDDAAWTLRRNREHLD